MNNLEDRAREVVSKIIAEALLRIISSIIIKAIDQPNNRELLTAMLRLKQPIKRIKEDITAIKHFANTIITNNRHDLLRI